VRITIQILTCCTLAGLLGAVGLRLSWEGVNRALRQCRFGVIMAANFVAVPALTVMVARGFGLAPEVTVAMILLAAAPFAPVVPIFARMSRGDLALAAGLTVFFPVVSVLLTPLTVQVALGWVAEAGQVRWNMLASLGLLAATIALPLAAGVWLRHGAPGLGQRLLRPLERVSEMSGAALLILVVVSEFRALWSLGWGAWLAMGLVFELSLALGWALGGPDRGTRSVVAIGTSNRNLALALLVALQSSADTRVVSAVVGNGLLLILLGLLHVGWWRWVRSGTRD
jgi:bile acid:Na+ symporter, BASS family